MFLTTRGERELLYYTILGLSYEFLQAQLLANPTNPPGVRDSIRKVNEIPLMVVRAQRVVVQGWGMICGAESFVPADELPLEDNVN
jgi:hypothetical protein